MATVTIKLYDRADEPGVVGIGIELDPPVTEHDALTPAQQAAFDLLAEAVEQAVPGSVSIQEPS